MIRRGGFSSRALALLVAFGPLAAAGVWLGGEGLAIWRDAGARLVSAETRAQAADAETIKAQLYGPLGEAWAEYAGTEFSGLSRAETTEAAQDAISERLAVAFGALGGGRVTVAPLPSERLASLERVRVEARGQIGERALGRLLEDIEARPPFLFVDYLEIERSAEPAVEGRGDGALLRVRMQLAQFRAPEDVREALDAAGPPS